MESLVGWRRRVHIRSPLSSPFPPHSDQWLVSLSLSPHGGPGDTPANKEGLWEKRRHASLVSHGSQAQSVPLESFFDSLFCIIPPSPQTHTHIDTHIQKFTSTHTHKHPQNLLLCLYPHPLPCPVPNLQASHSSTPIPLPI